MMRVWRKLVGSAASSWPPQPWIATHRHRKGGLYRAIGEAIAERDRTPVIIYDDEEGQVWVRAKSEFEDGRFVRL